MKTWEVVIHNKMKNSIQLETVLCMKSITYRKQCRISQCRVLPGCLAISAHSVLSNTSWTVHQHIGHVTQFSCCSAKLPNFISGIFKQPDYNIWRVVHCTKWKLQTRIAGRGAAEVNCQQNYGQRVFVSFGKAIMFICVKRQFLYLFVCFTRQRRNQLSVTWFISNISAKSTSGYIPARHSLNRPMNLHLAAKHIRPNVHNDDNIIKKYFMQQSA